MKSKSDFNAIKKALNNLKTKVNNNIVKLSFESNTGLIVSRELSCCRTIKTHNEDKEFKDFLKDTIDNGSFKTSGYIEVIKESDKEYFLKPGTPNGGVVTVQGDTGSVPIPVSQSDKNLLKATVAGEGTAGTPDAGVISIQGIAGMTPVQVSQDTASNLNARVVGAGTAGVPSGGVLTVQGQASMTPLQVTVTNPDNTDADGIPTGYTSLRDTGIQSSVASMASSSGAVASITFTTDGYLSKIAVSSSGKAKFEILIGTAYNTATSIEFLPIFNTSASLFNQYEFVSKYAVNAGQTLFIKGQNLDLLAQDLYGYLEGYQLI